MKRTLAILGTLAGCVGCDQGTKLMAVHTLKAGHAVSLLNGTIQMFYAENTGAFGSLGSQWPSVLRMLVFVLLPLVVLGVIAAHVLRDRQLSLPRLAGMVLIVGGGLGNVIDRIASGHVVDFLYLHLGPLRTNVFNVADVAVMAGLGLLLISRTKPAGTSEASPS